jgi:endonuclease YncB( thermonuclease family)
MANSAVQTAAFLSLFLFSNLVFAQSPAVSVQTYDQLLQAIRQTRTASQQRIEAAVRAEKVREAWETGKLIDEHILLQKERQKYGEQIIDRLAKDLQTDASEIRRMVEFARTYPIHVPAHELSWSHHQALLALNDNKEREEVAKEAETKKWTRDQVREEVRRRNSGVKRTLSSLLEEIHPGPLYTYQIAGLGGQLKIDLGFGLYRDLSGKDAKKFKEGNLVTLQKGKLKKAGPAPLYTYAALVTQVVDGDTFHALIDLGFETTLAQRVRLRRIDAPELVSAEGKQAKAALEEILKRDKGLILLQSRDLDQHGRPIADVWVKGKSVDQEMLDENLAVKIGA